MESAGKIAHLLLPEDAQQRRQTLHDLVNLITDDDAALLDELLARRRARYDILGNLPLELVLRVLDHLRLRDIHTYVRVSRRWRHLSQSRVIVNHLHSKWLPFDAKGSGQKSRDLSLTARKAYLGATGRFPWRLTTTYQVPWHEQEGAAPPRRQGLHHNRHYRDVVCMGNDAIPRANGHERGGFLYAHGVVAWPGTWPGGQNIYLHDLRRNSRRDFVVPAQSIMESAWFKLMALGNRLVVAASMRRMWVYLLTQPYPKDSTGMPFS